MIFGTLVILMDVQTQLVDANKDRIIMFALMSHSTSYICKELSIEDRLKKLISKTVKVIYVLYSGKNHVIDGVLGHYDSIPEVYFVHHKDTDVRAYFCFKQVDLMVGKSIVITQQNEPLGHDKVLHLR